MNRFRTLIIGGAVLALAAGAAVSTPVVGAQDRPTGTVKRPFARGDRMHGGFAGRAPLISIALKHQSELNLSAEQVSHLEKIRNHHQSQVTPLHQQLMAIEKDIAGLMEQTPANLIHIKAKIEEGEKLRSELRYQRVEALENGRSVLSAQQLDQLKTLVRSRRGQFHKPQEQPS